MLGMVVVVVGVAATLQIKMAGEGQEATAVMAETGVLPPVKRVKWVTAGVGLEEATHMGVAGVLGFWGKGLAEQQSPLG